MSGYTHRPLCDLSTAATPSVVRTGHRPALLRRTRRLPRLRSAPLIGGCAVRDITGPVHVGPVTSDLDPRAAIVLGTRRPVQEILRNTASVDVRAAGIGRAQHGLVTRAQLSAVGIAERTTRRRVTAGIWTASPGGVIDLGTHEPSWQQDVAGALLAAGADRGTAWASHRTAAYLHGFLDVATPTTLEVTVPRSRRPSPQHTRIHRVRSLPEDERTVLEGLPATSAARTILDLGATMPPARLEPILWDASRREPDAAVEVARCTVRWPYHRGRSTVLELMGRLHPQIAEVESPLEVYGLLALRDPLVPDPVVQYRVRDHHGRIIGRVDAAWPDARVAVEFDGATYHGSPSRRARDRQGRDRLRSVGWVVVEVTARDLSGSRLLALKDDLRRRINTA